MKNLTLDAMGVIFQARDDVAELLVPFIRKRSEASITLIEELYQKCSLGEFSSSVFWEKVGLSPEVEDEYLRCHLLVNSVKEFIVEARDYFDSIWCLSNDVSEWSAKLRQMFVLEELFDGFIISGYVNSRKPSPNIFKALFSTSNSKPKDFLFIDDRPRNVLAAIDQGMQSILFGNQSELAADILWAPNYSELKAMIFS